MSNTNNDAWPPLGLGGGSYGEKFKAGAQGEAAKPVVVVVEIDPTAHKKANGDASWGIDQPAAELNM